MRVWTRSSLRCRRQRTSGWRSAIGYGAGHTRTRAEVPSNETGPARDHDPLPVPFPVRNACLHQALQRLALGDGQRPAEVVADLGARVEAEALVDRREQVADGAGVVA